MSKVPHHAAYNCVLSSAYNCLRINCRLDFSFALLGMPRRFFTLYAFDAGLTAGKPREILDEFLQRIDVDLQFAVVGNVNSALKWADERLLAGEVLPAAINLRYSVLDPTRFDSDYWNFQLLVGRAPGDRYDMFDMFHGKYYTVERSYLQKMIDTPFNYRNGGMFTPFMQTVAHNMADTRKLLAAIDVRDHLLNVLREYDFDANIATAEALVEGWREKYLQSGQGFDMYNEIYRIMGSQIVISKGREQFVALLQDCFGAVPPAMQQLGRRWEQLSSLIPMALGRRDPAEYSRLQARLIELFRVERDAVRQTLALCEDPTIVASGAGV